MTLATHHKQATAPTSTCSDNLHGMHIKQTDGCNNNHSLGCEQSEWKRMTANGWLCRWRLVAQGHLRAPTSSTTWRETAQEAGRKRRGVSAGQVPTGRPDTCSRGRGVVTSGKQIPGAVTLAGRTVRDDPEGYRSLPRAVLGRSRGHKGLGGSRVLEAACLSALGALSMLSRMPTGA